MAALLIRTCLKRSIPKSLLCDKFSNDCNVKLSIALLDTTCLQCNCYHSTPVLWKKRKTTEQKRKLLKLKELELLNPKQKKKSEIISVWRNMTVKELAASAGRPIDEILDALFFVDNQNVYDQKSIFSDLPVLYETVKKLGAKVKVIARPDIKETDDNDEGCDAVKPPPPDPADLVKRRPVITIMGHVDHGKTTLLDSLRHSSVVDSEFGGITQHIGAFNVTLENGEKMTFLDTPGHAAFSTMRARGANITDIVILVVAADDGVMEQTVQSINMAKNANVPIVVAVNKIDKPNANIKRTHQMLAEHGIHVEDLGGDVQSVNISALQGTNLNQLMDAVLAQAEIMSLKGDPKGPVEGVVIEATSDLHRGKLATALIQRGTLRKGDVLVCGLAWAKVRSMFDHSGSIISQAGLSDAVQIIGWRDLPVAGDEILEVESERRAHMVMKYRHAKLGESKSVEQKIVADEKHQEHLIEYEKKVQKKRLLGYRKLKREGPREKENVEDTFPRVNVIIKGDVLGSVEAILDVLETYGDEKRCKLSVVHYGVGQVTETDLDLAKTFDAVVYCFNTKVPKNLSQLINTEGIKVRYHNVIYRLIDDLKLEINNKLPLVTVEEEIGVGTVLQEFEINEKRKKVKVAGCRCTKGSFKKSALFKVIRNGVVIYNGKSSSIRHLKEEVENVKTNMECGIKLDGAQVEFKQGDEIICYKLVDKIDETDWNPGF
ncbi:translation initiation factor IF-2, mitochondrial [Nasonia vitripennis]|uniref:Translation initiation factor IF-2, mitochondrial n=1 Tax=Nasonia vitripennis TaxID=7425 RepID=A0A7M7LIV7_NASVI|nr:translation initiation factor IF-2, mitochondrial [Nasonia vitripennis]XP_016840947.1 translation initiation factor IF-2, mitochondrial [Nasonia vitripennis]